MHTPAEILKGGVCLYPQKDYFGRFSLFFSTAQRAACCVLLRLQRSRVHFMVCSLKSAKMWAQSQRINLILEAKLFIDSFFGSLRHTLVSVSGTITSSPRATTLAWKTSLFLILACLLSFGFHTVSKRVAKSHVVINEITFLARRWRSILRYLLIISVLSLMHHSCNILSQA